MEERKDNVKEIIAANFTESVNILIHRSSSKAYQAWYKKGTHMYININSMTTEHQGKREDCEGS